MMPHWFDLDTGFGLGSGTDAHSCCAEFWTPQLYKQPPCQVVCTVAASLALAMPIVLVFPLR